MPADDRADVDGVQRTLGRHRSTGAGRRARGATGLLIDLARLGALTGPVRFVDTRTKDDYARGHIPEAIHFDSFDYANVDTRRGGLDKVGEDWREMFRSIGVGDQGTLVFYDVGIENRAPRPAVMLRLLGNQQSYVLHGGFYGWVVDGRPVSRKDAPPPPRMAGGFAQEMDRSDIATVDDVRRVLGSSTVLLDVRDDEEYTGVEAHGNPRVGRLPGAAHLVWNACGEQVRAIPDVVGRGKYQDFIVAKFKPAAAIRLALEAVGVRPSDDVILYCQRSHRASNVFLAMKSAGFPHVRIYVGSFREWSRREDLPIEVPESYGSPGAD